MSYHYLNAIDEDEIDDEEIDEDDDEDDDEEEDDVIKKINKRLILRDYTFYKIHKDGFENYVGSTVNLYKRKVSHKSNCNDEKSKKYNFPVYQYIRDNGGYDTFDYEILDTRFCSKVDAEIYEGELMKIHNSTLNVLRNYSKADKKEYNKQNQKKFREKYPDKKKEYDKNNREKNKKYRENNSAKNKQYQKEFREKNPEYHKEYYEKKKQEKQITINITINLP